MKNTHYYRRIPFEGNTGKAQKMFINALVPHGFKVDETHVTGCELSGPGMRSSRQNPLCGISHIAMQISDTEIAVAAIYGGILKLQKWLICFLCSMALFFVILFAILFRNRESYSVFIALAPFLPWPVLIPVLIKVFKTRTTQSLDVLLENMVALAKKD
jgi:hypothetical protein